MYGGTKDGTYVFINPPKGNRKLKRDVNRFEEVLGKLTNKMMLLGHKDYRETCEEIERIIEKL
ncbi:MAG: hypothetical protein MJ134_06705 [Lachnospiraceae bacterium]|nr:hypothetical protein [Lachnospiraceae bacterium]